MLYLRGVSGPRKILATHPELKELPPFERTVAMIRLLRQEAERLKSKKIEQFDREIPELLF